MTYQLHQKIIITAEGAREHRNWKISEAALIAATCALPVGPLLGGLGLVGKGGAIAIKVWASTTAICGSSGGAGGFIHSLRGNPPEAGQLGQIIEVKPNWQGLTEYQVRWGDGSSSWHKPHHLQAVLEE